MKNMFNKIFKNILICDLIFLAINISIFFILYLVNVRFRLWFIVLMLLISTVGLASGIVQEVFSSTDKKKTVILSSFGSVFLIIFISISLSIVGSINFKAEHTMTLDDQKYVAVVSPKPHLDVDYYDHYGFLLMGTKARVHGYFGKCDRDSISDPNNAEGVEYIFYDDKGIVKSKRREVFIKDKDGKITDKHIYDIDNDKTNKFDDSDNYLLPENEEVLYEKKFDTTILRFGKLDNILGQRMLVHVLRSKDNGKNFYVVSDDVLQVSNGAKFVFIDENLGFAINNGTIYLDNKEGALYVTNDGGKTFMSAKFNYINENVEYISIESLPYREEKLLKIKCSVYCINSHKDGYETKELIFTSDDEGQNWNLERN